MICVCGKEEMDGIECKFGASHMSLKASKAVFRKANPHVGVASATRERLPEKTEPKQGRFF